MPKKIRPIRVEGNLAFVTLTRGYEAVIDADDAALVGRFNWCARIDRRTDGSIRTVYADRTDRSDGRRKIMRMHRVIAGTPDGMEVDHEDGNGLNNRRSNLRNASHAQNQHNRTAYATNTSGFKGVSFHKDTGKWQANIRAAGLRKYLGLFETKEAAQAAYANASAELHGEFGRTK